MMDERKEDIRLQCLHIAGRACGEETDPEFVLQAAQDYYTWVISNKKPELRIVSNDFPEGAA